MTFLNVILLKSVMLYPFILHNDNYIRVNVLYNSQNTLRFHFNNIFQYQPIGLESNWRVFYTII